MKTNILSLLLLFLLFSSCNQQKVLVAPVEEFEIRNLDTMVVSASREPEPEPDNFSLPQYNPSATRDNDLLHTKLDLHFNWEKEQVIGEATLSFKPYFYSTSSLILDAKGFDIHAVQLGGPTGPQLKYDYDGHQITIQLDKPYSRDDEYTVYIDYTASPSESGGSAAITSDKGLFFINPRNENPDKPQQIWTQGETENNSRWFPTIDKPNERCTQEMLITVQDKFVTLSNGILASSSDNSDGTRTDYWKMDQPHAPYLFMLAIGEFAVVEESWNGIPVTYYVEPAYEEDATAIFSNTKEMLTFFSDILDVSYPWPKYAQVVVRDYVSGAMENTTSSIFGEFVQRHKRELIDDHNERIVAHELFHHWFGDFVTCENWANLTMNEGFANYSEYLWFEHKYGVDAADYHLLQEWSGYFGSGGFHPLIHFGYDDKEDMFDAHSYNKGGSVLHMLRQYVGDEAFFAALNLYLTDNAYTAVEAHNLRLAFEKVTGEDLNWFFNQWYFDQGHPQMGVDYQYDEASKQLTVSVFQVQDAETMPAIFQLPVNIDIYLEDGEAPIRHSVFIQERESSFTFDLPQAPKLTIFDADRALLAQVQDNKTKDEYIFQFYNAPKFLDRYESIQMLSSVGEEEAVNQLFTDALKDPFWVIRAYGMSMLEGEQAESTIQQLQKLANEDPHSEVRAIAYEKLMEFGNNTAIEQAKNTIANDSAYVTIGAALQYLSFFDKKAAMQYAQKLEETASPDLVEAISLLYVESGDPVHLPFFEKYLMTMDGFQAISFFDAYQQLASKVGIDVQNKVSGKLTAIAMDTEWSGWQRYAATRALNEMRKQLMATEDEESQALATQLLSSLKSIKKAESSGPLSNFYEQLLPDIKP
jgi:aminopeptidase N